VLVKSLWAGPVSCPSYCHRVYFDDSDFETPLTSQRAGIILSLCTQIEPIDVLSIPKPLMLSRDL
jgi:hypothetical protein